MSSASDQLLPAWLARDNFAPKGATHPLFFDNYDLTVSEQRWNKSYPYQLMVLKIDAAGSYAVYTPTDENNPQAGPMVFTLPIPPEALNISTPFAISGHVTLGGYVEQHGGAPIKRFTLRGTTGVMPTRGSADNVGTPGIAQSIFGGTIQAAKNVVGSFGTIVSGQSVTYPNVYNADAFSNDDSNLILSRSTGYYQFLLLQRFLETYVEMKKQPQGKTLRLAFAMWKDRHIYIVRPLQFDVPRTATSPLEYPYILVMEAFARISPEDLKSVGPFQREVSNRDPAILGRTMNQLRNVRETISAANDVLKGIRGDIQGVAEVVRQGILVLKDAIGVVSNALDLPGTIVGDLRHLIVDQWNDVVRDAMLLRIKAQNMFDPNSNGQLARDWQTVDDAANEAKATGTLGVPANHPAHDIFDHPGDHHDFFDTIEPDQLVLTDVLRAKIDDELTRVRKYTRFDFEQQRDFLLQASADYADKVGAGHATFNTTYGRSGVGTSKSTPSDADFDMMNALVEASIAFAKLAARRELTASAAITPIEYIAGLARAADIDIEVPLSKYTVPFPYGYTLEELAKRYLGDPDRWQEIAALNGLHSPYVDEEGFTMPLLVNGRGNIIVVADATNLYQGQAVWIQSNNTPRQKRHIARIDKLSVGLNQIALDGDATLDLYTTSQSAFIHAFYPYTVNSQMLVFIPSQNVAGEDPRTKDISGVNDFDHLLFIGGIDMLLTQTGDIVLTPDGDSRYSFGLTNIVQQARIIMGTPLGSLLHHPGFGLGIKVGTSTADVSAQELAAAAKEAFAQDRTFAGVQSATVVKNGPVAQLFLALGIAGTSQTVPIAVDVERS